MDIVKCILLIFNYVVNDLLNAVLMKSEYMHCVYFIMLDALGSVVQKPIAK